MHKRTEMRTVNGKRFKVEVSEKPFYRHVKVTEFPDGHSRKSVSFWPKLPEDKQIAMVLREVREQV